MHHRGPGRHVHVPVHREERGWKWQDSHRHPRNTISSPALRPPTPWPFAVVHRLRVCVSRRTATVSKHPLGHTHRLASLCLPPIALALRFGSGGRTPVERARAPTSPPELRTRPPRAQVSSLWALPCPLPEVSDPLWGADALPCPSSCGDVTPKVAEATPRVVVMGVLSLKSEFGVPHRSAPPHPPHTPRRPSSPLPCPHPSPPPRPSGEHLPVHPLQLLVQGVLINTGLEVRRHVQVPRAQVLAEAEAVVGLQDAPDAPDRREHEHALQLRGAQPRGAVRLPLLDEAVQQLQGRGHEVVVRHRHLHFAAQVRELQNGLDVRLKELLQHLHLLLRANTGGVGGQRPGGGGGAWSVPPRYGTSGGGRRVPVQGMRLRGRGAGGLSPEHRSKRLLAVGQAVVGQVPDPRDALERGGNPRPWDTEACARPVPSGAKQKCKAKVKENSCSVT